jgi:hypothetical protein
LQAPPLKRVPRAGLAGSADICASILCHINLCADRGSSESSFLMSDCSLVQAVKRSEHGKIDA